MNQRLWAGLLAAGLMGGGTLAQAALVTQTTNVFLTGRLCIAGATACDDVGPTFEEARAGVGGDTAASTTLVGTNPDRQVSGSAALLGAGAAQVEGLTTSGVGTRMSSNAFALERYTVGGAGPATLLFSGSMAYSQTVPDENASFPSPGRTGSRVISYLEIFATAGDAIETGVSPSDNFSAFANREALPGYNRLGFSNFNGELFTRTGSVAQSVQLNVNAGDSVWLYSVLNMPAANGAVVGARLDTSVQLRPIPEPSSYALTLASLGVVGYMARRRRDAAGGDKA